MNYLKGSTHLHLSADDKDRLFGNLLQIYEFSRYEFSWYSNICGIKRDGKCCYCRQTDTSLDHISNLSTFTLQYSSLIES